MMKPKSIYSMCAIVAACLLNSGSAFASGSAAQPRELLSEPVIYLVIGGAIVLLLAIIGLGRIAMTLTKFASQSQKRGAIFLALVSLHSIASAQLASADPTSKGLPEWAKDPNLYFIGFIVILLFFTVLTLYKVNIALIRYLHPEAAPVPTEIVTARPSWFRRVYLKLVDSVPVTQEKDILLDHDYDGIKELDNNLPPWWLYGFYITIAFGVIYLAHYHVMGSGQLQIAEYEESVRVAAEQKAERLRAQADLVTEDNVSMLTDPARIRLGKEIFEKMCAVCHRPDGGGQVGPNLTDEYWLHGGGLRNVFKTITYGVPAKGMISWKTQLTPKQIHEVSVYVMTLGGTHPESPKGPQGDVWVDAVSTQADTSMTKIDSTGISL